MLEIATAGAAERPRDTSLRLRLSELIGALSFALNLTEGHPAGHCLRCCWIGMQIGRRLGLRPDRLVDLYYTILLKDAGCSSNAERLWQLYGSDERTIKHGFKSVDQQSRAQVIRFLLRHAGVGEGLGRRARGLLHIASNAHALAHELV